jgi:hypothetical protein
MCGLFVRRFFYVTVIILYLAWKKATGLVAVPLSWLLLAWQKKPGIAVKVPMLIHLQNVFHLLTLCNVPLLKEKFHTGEPTLPERPHLCMGLSTPK